MSDSEASRPDLTQVFARFPDSAALIRRLAIVDERFSSICEDYALAAATLAALRKPAKEKQDASKVAEYTMLVADLEREMSEAIRNAT